MLNWRASLKFILPILPYQLDASINAKTFFSNLLRDLSDYIGDNRQEIYYKAFNTESIFPLWMDAVEMENRHSTYKHTHIITHTDSTPVSSKRMSDGNQPNESFPSFSVLQQNSSTKRAWLFPTFLTRLSKTDRAPHCCLPPSIFLAMVRPTSTLRYNPLY